MLDARYEAIAPLGAGTHGEVWLAHDRVRGDRVALKRISADPALRGLLRRELLAVSVLRVPGVVALRDEGEDERGAFLVFDHVDGAPFPGAPAPMAWGALRPTVGLLLEALAAIHAAGLVHGDLKPANVLVRPDGHPVVLDFGLAVGVGTAGRPRELEGSPRYVAPERLVQAPVDARADLYAVGVLLWEALTGRGPYPDGAPVTRKLLPPDPWQAPEPVPDAVVRAVRSLVDPDPDRRPATAADALERLAWAPAAVRLPLVGRDDALARSRARLSEAGRVRVRAGPGGGATRFLDELAARWVGEVVRPAPGQGPFASVAHLLGEAAGSGSAARQALVQRLRAPGVLCLVDRSATVDPWTLALLREAPRVVEVVDHGPADVGLDPLEPRDLAELFAGPERLLRVRSRAAAALAQRTQGTPALVAHELDRWVRHGLARAEGDRFLVHPERLDELDRLGPPRGAELVDPELDRVLAALWVAQPGATAPRVAVALGLPVADVADRLDRLVRDGLVATSSTGLRPLVAAVALQRDRRLAVALHAAVATTWPAGTVARCRHLLLGDRAIEAVHELPAAAAAARGTGEAPAALALLRHALPLAEADHAQALRAALADLTLELRTPDALDRTLRVLAPGDPGSARWASLLAAWRALDRGEPEAAEAHLDDVGEALASDPPSFFRWRATCRHERYKDDPRRAVEALRDAAAVPELAPTVEHWRGLRAYRDGRFADAARHHENALVGARAGASRCSALYNAAAAWLELAEHDRADAAVRELSALARESGLVRFEARSEWLARCLAYRRGAAGEPDLDLVEAVASLGLPAVTALVALNEAAVAWRAGHARAGDLAATAARSATAAGNAAVRQLGLAVGAATTGDRGLAQAALAADVGVPPGVALQVLGLAGPCGAADQARERAEVLATAVSGPARAWRREVLSVDEALDRLRAATRHDL